MLPRPNALDQSHLASSKIHTDAGLEMSMWVVDFLLKYSCIAISPRRQARRFAVVKWSVRQPQEASAFEFQAILSMFSKSRIRNKELGIRTKLKVGAQRTLTQSRAKPVSAWFRSILEKESMLRYLQGMIVQQASFQVRLEIEGSTWEICSRRRSSL